jgi:hypothetical protein
MISNAEMRAKATRKLEAQLERQVRQAQRRRTVAPVWLALGVLAALAGIILGVSSTYYQQAAPLQQLPSTTPVTTTTMPPHQYQPESGVDRFLRHSHSLGIWHHQGDGALVAAGNHMCDSLRQGVPVASVVLGNTEVMVHNGVNEKDADAFVWYALNDLCDGDLFTALPPGGYCVEGGYYNGTTHQCMTDHPTQSPRGATVTTSTPTNAPVPTSELQAYPCPTPGDPKRMCMNGVPLIPGTTATIPPLPPGLPYSPNGCPANGHPWCSNPTPTENPEPPTTGIPCPTASPKPDGTCALKDWGIDPTTVPGVPGSQQGQVS